MSGAKKVALLILGALAAALVVSQVVMGSLIASGNNALRRGHPHLGYTMAIVALIYIGWSMMALASQPTRPKP